MSSNGGPTFLKSQGLRTFGFILSGYSRKEKSMVLFGCLAVEQGLRRKRLQPVPPGRAQGLDRVCHVGRRGGCVWFYGWYDMFDVVLFVTGQACYMLNFLFSFDMFDVVTGVVTGLTS